MNYLTQMKKFGCGDQPGGPDWFGGFANHSGKDKQNYFVGSRWSSFKQVLLDRYSKFPRTIIISFYDGISRMVYLNDPRRKKDWSRRYARIQICHVIPC